MPRSPFVGSLCSSQGICGPYHFVPHTEAMYCCCCIPYSCIYDLFCKCCCGEMVYRAPCNNTCGKIFCSHSFLCCIKDAKEVAVSRHPRLPTHNRTLTVTRTARPAPAASLERARAVHVRREAREDRHRPRAWARNREAS